VTWLALLKAVLVLAGALLSWMTQRRFLEAGRAEAIAAALTDALDEITRANAARTSLRDDVRRDPASLRGDDGFRRSD
jgi:hypothetical protein